MRRPLSRRTLTVTFALAALLAAPAQARAPLQVGVARFDLLQVNQVVRHVRPGGSHPLCQAIPITAIRVQVKWSGAHLGAHGFPVVKVWLKPPGHTAHSRTITLAGTSDTEPVEFTPRSEHLQNDAFVGGRYKTTIKMGGKTRATTSLTLTQATKTC